MAANHSQLTQEGKEDENTTSSTLKKDSFSVISPDFYEPKLVLEAQTACCSALFLNHPPYQPPPKVHRKKNHIGRPMYKSTMLLSTIRNKNGKPLRKEYIRCQIIRATRKCVKRMINGLKAATGLLRFLPSDVDLMLVWQQMEQLVVCNRDLFTCLSVGEGTATPFKTYNDTNCRNFYTPAPVRKFHFLCMQVVYGVDEVQPKRICERMEGYCCWGSHTDQCIVKWEQFRNYVMFEMLEELGLKPYSGDEEESAGESRLEETFDDPDMFLA